MCVLTFVSAQEENARFLNLALHQGQVGKKLAMNMVSWHGDSVTVSGYVSFISCGEKQFKLS